MTIRSKLENVSKKLFGTLDKTGAEIMDPQSLAPPLGFVRRPPLAEQIRDMVRSEHLRQAAEGSGLETFEEADDFDIPDDPPDPQSQWENEFDPPISELLEAGRAALSQGREAPAGSNLDGLLQGDNPDEATPASSKANPPAEGA